MTAKQAAVKKYVVTFRDEERERRRALIGTGKWAARQVLKARILLKADASDAGAGWDYSFETVFGRHLEAYAASGGVLLGLSTSGKSRNVMQALEAIVTEASGA